MMDKRAESYVPDADLGVYAQKYAREQEAGGRTNTKYTSVSIMRWLRNIKNTHNALAEYAHGETRIPQEFEWLLDNYYLAEREGREAAMSLKKAGLVAGIRNKKNISAVFDLALILVKSHNNSITVSRIETFLEGAQRERALSEKELSIFVPMLKAALIWAVSSECARLLEVLEGFKSKDGNNPFAAELAAQTARESGAVVSAELLSRAAGAHMKHAEISAGLENAFTSLRALGTADLTEVLEESSAVERTLREDPAGVYTLMDDKSRACYRREISRLARKKGISEFEAAKRAIALSLSAEGKRRHVGYFILTCPLGEKRGNPAGGLYISLITLVTLFAALSAGFIADSVLVAIITLFPLSEIVKNAADFIAVRSVRPRYVPRMELAEGIPAEHRTLCVISALLTGADKGSVYAGLLEEYRIANRDAGGNIIFGILADLPDSKEKDAEGDRETVKNARAAIKALNEKYGGGYYLFLRERSFNAADGKYMGWERKRGAITELVRLLRGAPGGINTLEGDAAGLDGVKYLVTLDGDTRLNAGAARELAGAMMHPVNRPETDAEKGIVISGYGLLQPRISVQLESANKSLFSRIFAGQGGIDPYGSLASDVYHDLFDEASFTGKGIIDVEAFHVCLDKKFPENRVLSHDLLEGGFLRAGLVGDIELTDSYPYKVNSYFERMHRWTRGDWQALSWLSRRTENADGKIIKNHLTGISKWKILDNMRRSLVPVFMTAALLAGMISGSRIFAMAAAIAVLGALSALLLSGAELAFRGGAGLKERYHSTIIAGFKGVLLQTVMQLLFLPYQAVICLSAIITALYRLLISKKKLLSWVTSEDAERMSVTTVAQYYKKMAAAVVIGLFAAFFSGHIVGNLAGLCWLLSPAAACLMSRTRKGRTETDDNDRVFLLREAALIWRYFEDLLTREDNYLPPDNWQEQPAAGIAHRTSPTNIGLTLLCAVSALDLKLADKERTLDIIENLFNTISALPKWNGHLYNWYDTQTLRPLHPRCISTVDSGNLVGCLIALREALTELGDERADKLAARAAEFDSNMKFAPLYDKKRRLFHIGFDLETGRPTEGHYDLMASEARQTSYIAVARGEAPRRHWAKLGRTLVSGDRYNGMASWTGTMFEYLMPNLLMPCYENSLIYESAKFCLYEQKKRSAKKGIPWGISESAFYSFDPALNYQYKAHGVQRLGLKRGLNKELVISPYSTFLALLVEPPSAVKNLRELRGLGIEGRYGFYEALDYTQNRVAGNERFETVRCFMAHHIGMSMLAIDNVLNGNIMQERFMRDAEMKAFAELLQEKVPVGAVVMSASRRDIPEKPRRASADGWRQAAAGFDIWAPRCHLISNGSYTLFSTDTGLSSSVCAGVSLTRFERRQHGGSTGMQFYIKSGDDIMPLLPAPLFDENVSYGSVFDGVSACISANGYGLNTRVEARVPENENCELREISIQNKEAKADIELLCYFEPVLANERDYFAHPAFSKLFLETDADMNTLYIKRRARGDKKEMFMVFSSDSDGVKFDTSREKALGRDAADAPYKVLYKETQGTAGAVLDPCVIARLKLTVAPGESVTVRFALSAADRAADAYAAVRRVLKTPKSKPAGLLHGYMRLLGLSAAEVSQSFDMLCGLKFITEKRRGQSEYIEGNFEGQRGLWQFGISGDLPILAVRAKSGDSEKLALIIKQHRFLSVNGAGIDLVMTVTDGGDYSRPIKSMIADMLKGIDCENQLGMRGGVHVVDVGYDGSPEERMIFALCSLLLIPGETAAEFKRVKTSPRKSLPYPAKRAGRSGEGEPPVYLPDGSLRFETTCGLSDSAWCHMLSNGGLGYIATDAGTGNMWYKNARENKINQWKNDPQTLVGTERLTLRCKEFEISAFAGDDGLSCNVTYGPGFAVWEKEGEGLRVKTTAYVHYKLPARVMIIEQWGREDCETAYFTELIIGAEEQARNHVVTSFDPDMSMLSAQNAYTSDFMPQSIVFCAEPEIEDFTCDYAAWVEGRLDGETGAGLWPCAGIVLKPVYDGEKAVCVIVTGRAVNDAAKKRILSLTNAEEAYKGLEETREYWRNITGRLTVKTPDEKLDRYLNYWALYQVQACRLRGRSSIYQSGGAYGFRDQLQDVGALIMTNPRTAYIQLLRAAAHQYEEGDVQHWWHPGAKNGEEGDKGVRTRCSDDLLWLPFILCDYLEKTGDMGILDIKVPYIKSQPLPEGEHERYETPQISEMRENLYDHAIRAIEAVIARGTGAHGLILIGGGDWNDGFDRVGIAGRGESVWLTWFFAQTLIKFGVLCTRLGQRERAERYGRETEKCIEAANNAWDGSWFLRGYYDDGGSLGSSADEECRIDAIAQSFAALTPGADSVKADAAMASLCGTLFDRENKIIKLFSPPFSNSLKNPGYIKGYLPGVRENGGQYTHAAIWSALGCLRSGRVEDGYEMLSAILPGNHDQEIYKVEPYVIAADVYSNPAHMGRGGWSWYTGAASWYYRVATEELLGIKLRDGSIYLEPNLPQSWNGYEAEIKNPNGRLLIRVSKSGDKKGVYLDGEAAEGVALNGLTGEHTLECYI